MIYSFTSKNYKFSHRVFAVSKNHAIAQFEEIIADAKIGEIVDLKACKEKVVWVISFYEGSPIVCSTLEKALEFVDAEQVKKSLDDEHFDALAHFKNRIMLGKRPAISFNDENCGWEMTISEIN